MHTDPSSSNNHEPQAEMQGDIPLAVPVENDDQLEGTWQLHASHNYSSLDYTANKIVQKSKALFTKAFLSYA